MQDPGLEECRLCIIQLLRMSGTQPMADRETKLKPASGGAPATPLVPDQKIGSYSLLEKLGAGGIGEVWKARDRRLNRVVALKFISLERHGSSPLRDLLREARAASVLNHPNRSEERRVGKECRL